MIKSKKQMFTLIASFLLVILLGTVSYAFFNYTRTGISNTIRVGRIYFNTTQDNTINLTNVFPTDSNNLDNTNSATVTVNITGDTEYSEGIEYKVSIVDVQNVVNGKEVPISFNVEANDLGTESNDYYNDRGSTTNVYNLVENGTAENNKIILVGYIKSDNVGINGSVDITAYLNKDEIGISDTVSRIENNNLVYGETNAEWIAGRTILTTTEWNGLQTTGVSFKVKVEANEGIWIEEPKFLVMKNLYTGGGDSNWMNIKDSITSIEFSTNSEVPANAITSFDVTDINSEGPVTIYTLDDGLGNNTVKAVICADDVIYAPANSRALFASLPNLTSINFENTRMDNVEIIKYMFASDTKLVNVIIPDNWNSFNIEDMNGMFYGCTSLANVDGLAKMDTSSVKDMAMMFCNCSNLTNVNGLVNWNTSSVEDMTSIFYGCSSLANVNGLVNWNTSNVEDMNSLLANCTSLSNIDGLTNWDTSSVTDMNGLFLKCTNLSNINVLAKWDTSSVTTMYAMFNGCTNLENVSGLSNWNVSNVHDMGFMFTDCSKLYNPNFGSWDMSNITSDKAMFQAAYFRTIVMPNNYTRIDDFMFNHNGYYSSSSFTIPSTVTSIGNSHIFYDFGTDATFTKFIVENGNTSFKTIDDILYSYDGTRLISIPRGKTFTNNTYEIPEGITFMNELSFSRNYNIDTVVLPNSYVIERYIEANTSNNQNNNNYGFINSGNTLSLAIYQFTSVKSYVVKSNNPNYSSDSGCIYNKNGTELIAVPLHYNGVLNIKSGTTTIGQEAFWIYGSDKIDSLTGINIPASVTTIESKQLTLLNNLMRRSTNPVTITIDSGNTAYEIVNNQIVAK